MGLRKNRCVIKFKKMRKNNLQRLLLPPGHLFGGVGVLSGIPKKLQDYILSFCNFDYMGATEYELGAITKSMDYIFKHKEDYIFIEKEVCGKIFIFLVEVSKYVEYSNILISSWMQTNYDGHGEYSGLKDLYDGIPFTTKGLVGWLDIDDNAFFFIATNEGREMANKFKELLLCE